MLLKDVRAMTAEQAQAARVTATRLPATCEWVAHVNGDPILNASTKEQRTFAHLDALIAALDQAGINTLTLDIHVGKTGKWRAPEFQPLEDTLRSYVEMTRTANH
jgi:hypothetical protein